MVVCGLWLLIPRDGILLTEGKKRGRGGEEFEGDEWTCCDILRVRLDIQNLPIMVGSVVQCRQCNLIISLEWSLKCYFHEPSWSPEMISERH